MKKNKGDKVSLNEKREEYLRIIHRKCGLYNLV